MKKEYTVMMKQWMMSTLGQSMFIGCLVFVSSIAFGQEYDDYLGAGHSDGIKVRTSSNSLLASGINTIDGSGFDARKKEASRFLFQASFGGDMEEVSDLATSLDYEGWIDNQFGLSKSLLLPKLWEVDARARELFEIEKVDPDEEYYGPWAIHFQYAWWDNNFKAPDQLRQRIAFALSQILVISINSQLREHGDGLASYHDILINNAFGNYEDILQEVSVDPNMAYYLTHLNNPKTDDERGTKPDENYAREIMQLFSIGLYELNNDGSRKVDDNGEWIPTYDNRDIQELAKVFTGLKGAQYSREALMYFPSLTTETPVEFGTDIDGISREHPLVMHAVAHERGPKTIIGDFTIPEGQTGMEDIQMAVSHIFNHPNVGPFIARRLIQNLIKSNPTPQYIDRVATAFNDNGNGVRGDMQAVIKAIFLDDEARSCETRQDPTHGKLREPLLRYTHLMHSVPTDSPDGYYWNNGYDFFASTKQLVSGAPSVFNHFLPDYQPVGEFTDEGLVGPEFQIHNSQTAIGYLNQAHKWSDWGVLFWDWNESTPNVDIDYQELYPLATDPMTFINHLDILLTHGRLSDETRNIILEALTSIPDNWDDTEVWRVNLGLYLFMISPDYVVFK